MEKIKLHNLNEVVYHDITDEGLNIYMLVNKNVRNFYMTLNVRYGSIDTEYKKKGAKNYTKVPNGIAHFIEHLMFYQPDGSTSHEYFNKLGSSINACTTNDFTFYEVFGSTNFKKNLNYLLDYVYTPYFNKENIKSERSIINEEIKMYEDNPNFKMIIKTHECLWHKNKRKYLISGTMNDLKKISVDNVYDVYNNFYHPSNMFIVITGNFNPEEASVIIKENLRKKEFAKYDKPVLKDIKESSKVVNDYYEENVNVKVSKIKLSYKISKSSFKDYRNDELKLYLDLLLKNQFGITSDIHEKLFNNSLITTPLTFGTSLYENYFTLTITAETNYPDEVLKILEDAFSNISIDENDITRFKRCRISSLVLTFDDIEDVNALIQDNLISENKIIDDTFNIINNLNINDLNKIIKKLNLNNKVAVVFRSNNL